MWIEAEPISLAFISFITSGLDYTDPIRTHLIASAPHLRLFIMGSILLITLRFMPRGVIPEKIVRPS
jgi:branched-chain amino acid transport system permease protein